MRSTNNLPRDAVHVFVLCAFAVAQPLYDLLGRHATFFIAHDPEPAAVVWFALVLSLGLPGALVLVEAGAALISSRLRRALHLALIAALAALIALPPLNRSAALPDQLILATAALVGILAATAYARVSAVRSVCTVLAPSVLLFPGLFLFASQAAEVVRPDTAASGQRIAPSSSAPVVVIVFDELSLFALMNEQGAIDAVRFPNFAALAGAGIWYRNATSVADYTPTAVPAILTGLLPTYSRLPTVRQHPDNLFTLLGGTHRMQVAESVTEICPPDLCPRYATSTAIVAQIRYLLADAGVIYLHMIAPSALRARLPDITRQWTFQQQGWFFQRLVGAQHRDRAREFVAFVDAIAPNPEPTLYFAHVLLPHYPYEYLPSGMRYNAPPADFRRRRVDPTRVVEDLREPGWEADNRAGARAQQQRYLLQLGLVDALVGRLLDRLRQTGLYEQALVVVTADHGVSFRPGESQRFVSQTNYPDILWVPLFVKLPGQSHGRIDDRNVETIDILPTIADALGTTIPWRIDGRSALAPEAEARPDKVVFTPINHSNMFELSRLVFPATPPAWPAVLANQSELFGSGAPIGQLLVDGPFPELIGRGDGVNYGDVAPFALTLKDAGQYGAVDPASGGVPSFVSGRLYPLAGASDTPDVAVTVNGVIAATTQTFVADDRTLTFGVLLPDTAFRPGANRVKVFAVTPSDRGPLLHWIAPRAG